MKHFILSLLILAFSASACGADEQLIQVYVLGEVSHPGLYTYSKAEDFFSEVGHPFRVPYAI